MKHYQQAKFFNNMQELMTHLLNGGAITNMDDSCPDCWVSFYDGNLHYPDRKEPVVDLGNPTSWRPVPTQWLTNKIHRTTNKTIED